MLSANKRKYIEILIHTACWIGVYYTLSSLTSSQIKLRVIDNGIAREQHYEQTLFPYIFITLGFLMLLFYGNIFWLFSIIIRYKNVLKRVLAAAGWFLLIFAANYFIVGDLLKKPGAAIHEFPDISAVGTINRDVRGWGHTQLIMLLIFLGILGISVAYFSLREWAKSELLHNQLQAHQLDTEIKFLKSQISPHFLFNTLNNLFSIAQQKGNDELADGISKLSGMMRYMIYESNGKQVSLQKEIEYLQNCIMLNELRYAAGEVSVVLDYPNNMEGIFVAPMIFIPFVENAFKHGVSIGHSSAINISFTLSGKQLVFNCENNKYNFVKRMEAENSGIGLENIRRRLALLYPGTHELVIDDRNGKYNVTLKIDLG
ncbi:sensor histidine kinase [Chitinophaga sp.]|uniref:sensor histidine kinase n=1 Tax=Chitinophaga sp. TaxID=1869181 RepID=UPI0031DC3836